VYVVDVAGDVITEISGEGTDQVNVAFTVAGLYTLGANVENATVTSAGTLAVNVTGNAENNLLTGNAGANSLSGAAGNDTLIGGAGIDKMAGGTGNDVYVVDVATDVVTEALNEGTDFVSVAFAVAGTYTLTANVENATAAAGTLAINLVGSTDNNLLTGNAAANSLSGGDGNDDLMGGDGNDTLLGGAGRDSLRGGAGNDSIDGGIITDRINYTDSNLVYYTDATAGVNVNLSGITGDGSTGTGTAQDGLGGTDTLANVNRVIGSSLNDTLTGSTALLLEQFDGGAGDDTIDGGVITDTLNRDNNNRVLYDGAVAAVTVNLATGTATGGAGNDKLLNINQVRGSAYGDWLTGSNSSITESFFGLAGDDTIDGAGGYDAARYEGALAGVNVNLITGSASDGLGGTDTLFNIEGIHGSDFADVLTGGSTLNGTGATDGLEFFRGGGGSDIIDGGAGYDRVDYTSSTAGANVVLGGTANGTAQDGLGGTDTLINIEAVGGSAFNDILTGSDTGVFESFEGREGNDTIDGKGGTDRADYQNSTAGVTVNLSTGLASDGYGGTDALLNIENVRGSRDFNDSITGSAGDNKIEGLGGNDTINGMAGNDALYAGTGVDVVDGGTESDTLVVMGARVGYAVSRPNATDTVLVNAGTGENITIRNVENVQFTDGTLTWTQLTANSASPFADLITGTAGNDTLNGLAGNDTLVGLAGDDLYVVDVATDVVTEALNEGTDLVNVAFAAAGTYTLPDNVENATAATGTIAINLVGNTSNNVLTGNAAANSLTGGDGNDTLDGGAGSDTMVGGVGNDVYVVDIATDVVNETAVGSSGVDEVRTSLVSYTLGASTNIENLRYTGSASFSGTGNALNNAIWGGSGNDLLTGGLGDDSLYGGKGDDTYIVDSAADVVAEFASAGTDSVQSSVSYTLADNVENLALTGTAAIINGTGNALSNVLTGNTAANILTGGDGNDTLDGGTDTDTLVGGAGNDTYVVDRAGDVITENPAEGIDQVNVAYVGSGGTYTLGADVENAFVSSASTIAVNLVGNALDNVLTGNAAANILIGGAGNDTLQGGLGADVYVVDAVGDVVIELGGSDIDRVQTALASYTLPFLVENLTYTGSSAFTGKGNFDRNVIIGGPGDDTLIGAGGSDTIDGGPAGDDVMVLQGYQSSYAFARLGPASSTFTQGLNVTTALNIESVIFDADGNLGTTNDQTLVSLGMLATAGNDTLTGDDDVNDNLNGLAGNDSISGGGGDDMLQGGPGVDTLVGGPGNDLLDGGDGSDVYRFSMGQGDDIIDQNDTVAANIDTLEFTDNIAPGDVTVSRGYHTYDDLVVRTSKGGNVDQVIVSDFFKNDAVNNAGAIDQIRFTGGDTISTNDVLWTRVQLATKALTGDDEDNTLLGYATTADSMSGGGGNDWMMGSAGNDTLDGGTGNDALYGGDGTDTLVGGAGNDYLAGGAGNDSLDGGPGNDSMTGGSGSDTYRFGNGSGQDVINDDFFTDVDGRLLSSGDGPAYYVANGDVPRSSDVDVLNFGGGVLPSQLQLTRAGNDLLVNLADPGDQLTIRNFFSATIPTIEKFVFADGTSWTGTTIRARVIQPTAGDDSFIGYVGADRINGLAGNDTINGVAGNDTLNGGDGNDSLLGDLGNDSLMGDAGNDTLSGGAGNNTLIGGTGNDQMSGGTGNDVYRYTLGDGLDGITDAGGTADRIEITAAAKTTADLVVSRLNGTGRMIAISGQDALAITNHDGAGAVETFALNGANFSLGSLATGVDRWDGTIGTDSLSGGSNAERMMGNASNDILQGNDGNDSLVGGTGNDTLYGGKGDDQYVFNPGDGADVITETSGTDALVFAGTASTDWRFSLTASDALLMQRIADPSDSVTVTNFGLDVAAGTGPSLIESFQFTGGTPTTLNVSDVTVLVSTGTSGDDSIIGTSGADTLTGLAGNDTLQGNNGNDNLLGGASDDSLYGGKGDDTLVGGAGADSLLGGDGNDRYVFASGDGADVITEASGTDTLVFSGMASTEWRFSLTQDSALRIERIADPTDSVTVANFGLDVAAGTGPSLIESFQFTGGTPATLTVADVRALVGTGTSGADSIIGTSAADTLDGLAGNDTLQGNNGNDSLLGGAGDDSLYGGKGDDVLVGGAGDNWLDGGSGNDMYRFGSTATGISTIASDAGGSDLLQLDDGVTITARAWEDTSLRLTLSQGGEILVTSPDAMEQVRFGSAPATGFGVLLPMDTVTGTSGNDILGSSSSTNPVMLDGSGGNDTLYGGKGDDILVGGAGADTLVGSMGSDEYQFSSGWGQDVISDTGGSLDVINLSGTGLSPSQVFAAKDSDGSLVLTRSGGSDLIQVYNHFTNSDSAIEQIRFFDNTVWTAADIVAKVLAPTDGSDSLVGFSSNDSISGGLGDDTLRGGAGNDTLNGDDGQDLYLNDDGSDVFMVGLDGDPEVITYVSAASTDIDTLRFSDSVGFDKLWFKQSGNDLLVTVLNTLDTVTLTNWFAQSPTQRLDLFEESSGQKLYASDVQTLVEAMAAKSAIVPVGISDLMAAGYEAVYSAADAVWN
jgi:Ca2+-binding RTX toxin-like protein